MGAHENWVLGTVFGVDGKRVVSVGRDRSAKLTDATSGAFQENVNLLRGELAAVARHPSNDIVVIGGEDRIAYVYLMDRPKNMKIADDSTQIRKLERQNGAIGFRRCEGFDGVVAIDCGANIGVHTIEWATSMTGWGSVLSIEARLPS